MYFLEGNLSFSLDVGVGRYVGGYQVITGGHHPHVLIDLSCFIQNRSSGLGRPRDPSCHFAYSCTVLDLGRSIPCFVRCLLFLFPPCCQVIIPVS